MGGGWLGRCTGRVVKVEGEDDEEDEGIPNLVRL